METLATVDLRELTTCYYLLISALFFSFFFVFILSFSLSILTFYLPCVGYVKLKQITRTGQDSWDTKNVLAVSFAPLILPSRAEGESFCAVDLRKFVCCITVFVLDPRTPPKLKLCLHIIFFFTSRSHSYFISFDLVFSFINYLKIPIQILWAWLSTSKCVLLSVIHNEALVYCKDMSVIVRHIMDTAAPQSKNTVCAFWITCRVLSFALENSWRN